MAETLSRLLSLPSCRRDDLARFHALRLSLCVLLQLAEVVQKQDIHQVLDSELGSSVEDEMEVVEMLQVALLCIRSEPDDRPTMEQVANMLGSDRKGLTEQWSKWQTEAARLTTDGILRDINNPAAWENLSTGIDLDAGALHGPGR